MRFARCQKKGEIGYDCAPIGQLTSTGFMRTTREAQSTDNRQRAGRQAGAIQ
jgi:hypothetical protein